MSYHGARKLEKLVTGVDDKLFREQREVLDLVLSGKDLNQRQLFILSGLQSFLDHLSDIMYDEYDMRVLLMEYSEGSR